MLERAASIYRRPLVTFYMSQPPARGDRGEDFRATKSASERENATLDALLRDVRARQQMVRVVLDDAEEAQPRPFVGSARIEDGPKTVAAAIRTALGVSEDQQRRSKDVGALFSLLRSAAERIGIYVLLLGDVGSYHSDIGEDVFRGFALADDVAPFVVINDNDAAVARSFTLMHEIAHIWIGESGVSGPLRDVPDNVIERFCNDTASEFLLPSDAILDYSALLRAPLNDVTATMQAIGSIWKVSEPAVAYRFVQKGWISRAVASQLFAIYADRWRQQKKRERENRQPDDTGPTYYQMGRFRLGPQRGRDHGTGVAHPDQLPMQPIPGRACFVAEVQSAVMLREPRNQPANGRRVGIDLAQVSNLALPAVLATATACRALATSNPTKTSLS